MSGEGVVKKELPEVVRMNAASAAVFAAMAYHGLEAGIESGECDDRESLTLLRVICVDLKNLSKSRGDDEG